MGKLDGKVAIITGAALGMGKAAAILFAQEGAKVVVADVQDEHGNETVKIINEGGGKSIFVHTDVSKVEDVKNLIKTAVDTYGKLDIMYNNAGISGVMEGTIDTSDDVFEKLIAIDIMGVWYGIKYGAQQMSKTGGGVIINTSSVTGYTATPWMNAYSTCKAAVIQLTKTAAQEFASRNIRVNCIAPGQIDTPMLNKAFMGSAKFKEQAEAKIPMGRYGKPEEIAKVALFLACDDSSYVSGQTLPVDGAFLPR